MNTLINCDTVIVAGNLRKNWEALRHITSDSWILNCVKGLLIPFIAVPVQEREPFPFKVEAQETFVKS